MLQRTGVSEQKVLYDTVELRTGRTLSVQLGAWPMLVYGIATLAVIQGRRRFQKVGESDLDPQGDGTIVHELDGHIGTEPAGGDDRAGRAQRLDHGLDQRLGLLRAGRLAVAGTPPLRVSPYSVNWLTTRTS